MRTIPVAAVSRFVAGRAARGEASAQHVLRGFRLVGRGWWNPQNSSINS
jgi:hypothetical protein